MHSVFFESHTGDMNHPSILPGGSDVLSISEVYRADTSLVTNRAFLSTAPVGTHAMQSKVVSND